MEKMNTIIIVGLILIIIALLGIALNMFNEQHQQSTQIEVLGNGTIEENGTLNVKLSLSNGTGIENKTMKIAVIDENDKEVLNKTVYTNSEGESIVDLDNISKGEYEVNITFEGDEKYSVATTSQKIKIIEKKATAKTTESSQTTGSTQTTESTQQNEMNTESNGVQHNANEWEYTGSGDDVEYYTTGSGDQLVIHDDGAYEYYDGRGNVVGGYV